MLAQRLRHTARKPPLIVIYVPKTPEIPDKSTVWSHLHTISGNREDTAQVAFKQAQTTYYASHYWNPYFFHGTKTCIFEIVEQLGWKPPDILIVPVGMDIALSVYRFGFTTRDHR
jgi:threonine synthase